MSKNPEAMIGKRVSVYWEEEDENMEGRIDDYNPDHGWHILYYSGDQEWVDTLDNVEFDDDGTYTNERRYSRTRAAESKLEFAKTGITEDLDEKLMQFYADTKHDFNFNDDNHDDNENENDNYNNRNRSLRAESKDGTGTLELNIIPDSDEATSPVRIGMYNNNNNNDNNNNNNNNNNINNNNNNDDDDDDDENDNKIRQSTNSVNTTKTAASEYDVNKQPLNAVLLSGTIHSAKDLPNYDDDPFNESNIFFRVLYVEAGEKGNESTMFRCKTTIFKSENVPYGNNPRWNLDNFNFEMVLPENIVNGMKKPNVSALRGEILVAVYRNKGDSGNDFIGQTSFNLAKMIRYSKVINPKDTSDGNKIKIQIREEKGNFPLMNRNGEINNLGGSISAQFRIRWHGSPIMSKMEKAVTLKRNKSNKKSAAEAQAEAARKVQASSGYGKTLKTAKDLNRGAQWEAYRRIAQGRLDMHNEIFVNRLLRDAKGRQLTEAEKEVLKVYEKAAGEGKSKGSNNKAVKRPEWNERIEITALDEEMRRRESNKVSSGGGVGGAVGVGGGGGSACISSGKGGPSRPNQTRLTMDQLIQQKDMLKSEVTKLTQESRDLKATKIRLERTLQRYETTVKRSKEAEKHGLKPKSITKNNNSMTSGNTGSISPFIDIDIDNIVDRELKDMVSEHYSLQAIRRNIVSRKSKAESEIKSIETSLEDMKARQLRAWQRLGNFQSEKDNEDGSHIDEDQSWLEQKAMDTFEKERAEVERLDIQQKENLHIGEVEDELEELYATKDALKTLILEAERSIDKFKYERDLWHERHSGMVGDNMVQLLNDGLKRMRWEHQRNKTSKMNISDIATGINKLDLSLLRFKLLQSQADYASESQRRVEERSAVRMDTLIENNDTTIGSNIDGIIDNGGAVSVEISPQTPSTQSKLSVVEKARKDSITMDDLIVSP